MRRVLKTASRLIFLEHGRASDRGVFAWQDRHTPFWKHIACGCHLNRKVDELIIDGGFQITELKTGYLPGPRATAFTYQSFAQPMKAGG